jgi:ABC-2 type transport system ATP-binding protein
MGSVEELCDHIALINKSVKIEDGPTSEIREKYKSNIYKIKYTGEIEQVNQVLGERFRVLDHIENEFENLVTIQHLNGKSNNELLQTLMPVVEIRSFEEVIPSMNDVFIKAVEESNKK